MDEYIPVNFLVKDFQLFKATHGCNLVNMSMASKEPNGWTWVIADLHPQKINAFHGDTNIVQKDFSSYIGISSNSLPSHQFLF